MMGRVETVIKRQYTTYPCYIEVLVEKECFTLERFVTFTDSYLFTYSFNVT